MEADPHIRKILEFWFHGPGNGKHYWAGGPGEQEKLDELIRREFGTLVAEAATGTLSSEWSKTANDTPTSHHLTGPVVPQHLSRYADGFRTGHVGPASLRRRRCQRAAHGVE